MQQILVTPVPEFVFTTPVERFFHGQLFSDLLNTVITLGALGLAFYMFYSFSKYGKFGRDVSRETQKHDKQSLVDMGLIEPVETKTVTDFKASDTVSMSGAAAHRPAAAVPKKKNGKIGTGAL
jgi:hypothetical protein